ncbi:MAG: DUF11 domain-containing protein, partial [Burkholderiales bacterium]|nr:DUF11 domain-containing protein [Burkholderiales bacterium]
MDNNYNSSIEAGHGMHIAPLRGYSRPERKSVRSRWNALIQALGLALALMLPGLAVADFLNGGFETGTYANWTKTGYVNNDITTYPPLTVSHLGLAAQAGDLSGIVTGAALSLRDEMIANCTPAGDCTGVNGMFVPLRGTSAARINLFTGGTTATNHISRLNQLTTTGHTGGNSWTAHGQHASSIKQTVTVTAADVSPIDGLVHIRFNFASVLDNPPHALVEQPYFAVELRRVGGPRAATPVPGAPAAAPNQIYWNFNISSAVAPWTPVTTDAGGGSRPYVYKNWELVDVAPGAAALDVGDIVELELIASGCSLGGHEGHVYLDDVGFGVRTLTLTKATVPPTDTGKFDLQFGYIDNIGPITNPTGAPLTAPGGSNRGNGESSTATNVNVADTINLAEIANVASGTLLADYTSTLSCVGVGANATNPTISSNTGTTGSFQMPSNDVVCTFTNTRKPTDLALTKTDGAGTYTPGNAISYTLVVSNAGPGNATGASVADTVPANITGVTANCVASGTASCGTNASAGNAVSFTGVNINAGAGNFLTITISGTVNPAATGNLVNTATVTAGAGQTDPTPGNDSATDTDTPAFVTNLGITKTDGSATYTAGAAISYTIVVSNTGPSNATGASVADAVPANITGVTANCVATGTANCGTNASVGNAVSFTGVNIAAGAGNFLTITVSGTVSPSATGNLVNTATVTSGTSQSDPTPGNNSATDTDTPAPQTNLGITKTDGSATYTAGAAISYTIVVSNTGPSNATGASVADTVPAAITGVTANCVATGTASCGANASVGNAVSFTGVNINTGAGNFLTITVSGTVSPSATGDLVNTATVTAGAGQTDPTPGNDSATDTDTPAPQTNLGITKTDGSA